MGSAHVPFYYGDEENAACLHDSYQMQQQGTKKEKEKKKDMYTIETQVSFDSAHFLAGYQGKCGNIHGHRWTVKVIAMGEQLEQEQMQTRGMLMDFSSLKAALRELGDALDHVFIVERGTLAADTMQCLERDGFRIVEVPFRPTAENFVKWFYDRLDAKGYPLQSVVVYETPNNCATYRRD